MPVSKKAVSKKILCRHWVHSHEEDTETEMVFRPADHAFPPSRGRLAFELGADGAAHVTQPGATDRPAAATGSWTLEEDVLAIETPKGSTRRRVYRIASASRDRLVTRRG